MGSDSPDTLISVAAKFCTTNLHTLVTKDMELREGVSLPTEICEKLLDSAPRDENFEKVVDVLKDTSRTRLERIDVRGSQITDSSLKLLLNHKPYHLDIHNCPRLTSSILEIINKQGSKLESLVLGNTSHILPENLKGEEEISTPEAQDFINKGRIFDAPLLKKLVIWNHGTNELLFWETLLNSLIGKLVHLDLSGCLETPISILARGITLVYLNLYNVILKADDLDFLCNLKYLRFLDISQSNESASVFQTPNEQLEKLVKALPFLTSLDISGTNLAGRGILETKGCDIPGLNSRINRPLDFLGLYNTHHDASHRAHIPAKRISGDKNEEQILIACQAYLDRHEVLEKVLNDLFHQFRSEKAIESQRSLSLILTAMQRHLGEKHVQISASASLFYIVKMDTTLKPSQKREILKTLIQAMEVHKYDPTMMRNGCLTICHFKIPQDVMFEYKKLVTILLEILSTANQEEFVERIAIYLLNSLACQVDGGYKKLVGELGAIQKMLGLIKDRLEKSDCDDVMEIAWSTMWNVTDETAENCALFLENDGMDLFLKCLNMFGEKPELLRNMMGLLGNVAEVENLRPNLMTSKFIQVFYNLLDSTQDTIEVSYNSAGILAHILSDGPTVWKIQTPTRFEVQTKLRNNVNRWDRNSPRNINYRSFEPILRLVRNQENPECQLWGAWALSNLTTVYADKYCLLLEQENGVELITKLLKETTDPDIREYFNHTITNCSNFQFTNVNSGDEIGMELVG